MRLRGATAVLAAWMVAWTGALSAEKSHTVQPGESASAIAKRYYGSYDRSGELLIYNDKSDSVLQVGETLRVPYCPVHRIEPGDSWSAIAERYLDRVSAYSTLASLNGIPVEAPLRVGERITIPAIFRHRLERGETLATLAERFYGDPARATVLQEFNTIDDPRRLAVGAIVEIPVVDLPLVEPEALEVTAAVLPIVSAEPVPEPPSRFMAEIEAAESTFEDGDYALARNRLEGLRGAVREEGNDAENSDLLRLLTFVYVAYDLHAAACDAWEELVELDSTPRLDPDRVSPKILEAVSRCRSRAPGSSLD